jgi:hypothetical protein
MPTKKKLDQPEFIDLCRELGIVLPEYEMERIYQALAKRVGWVGEEKANEFIKAYCDAFKVVYGTFPEMTSVAAGTAKRIVKDLGSKKACELVETYLQMRDSFFLTKHHDLQTFASNLNKITVAHKTGKTITQTEIRQMDQRQSTVNSFAKHLKVRS